MDRYDLEIYFNSYDESGEQEYTTVMLRAGSEAEADSKAQKWVRRYERQFKEPEFEYYHIEKSIGY